MRRTSLSVAAGLAAALLVAGSPAQAAVSAKDLPKSGDIVKAFPELAGATFSTDKSKQISVPGNTCGVAEMAKAKSAIATTGASAAGFPVVVAGAAEVKSAAKAKAYLKAYTAYTKKCATFTEPTTGATVTSSITKAPKVGQGAVAFVQETTVFGITSYSSSVLYRDGNRVGNVVAIDDAPVSASAIAKLAKVGAKKLK
ncbi:hypothetical protein F4692_002601 [Nocardioides cavernae]|uniref:Sensor domain-containing protein n=1 Tax=Nocardioides cavernae TaxID=1921566 RepID=A0A7Y9KU23_9ACTN|nr:hypothetical protein [Nocardioides cavernae]NYE37468.1 hypothetical protein [Nocardioides cavernae]